jgi:hypothetical protein
MEFVVWGIGLNGTVAVDFVGIENIVAFIDTNTDFIGENYFGRPVIDFDTYRVKYKNHFILITPKDHTKIVELLEQEKVNSYLLLSEILF